MGGVVFCAGLEVASDVSEYGEMGVLPVHAGRISFFFIWLYVFGLVCKDEGVGSRGGCRNNPVASFMPMALIDPGLLYIQEG